MEAGSITFSTALDNKQLEKDLNSLTKKIEKSESSILATRKELEKAKESASKLAQKLSDARTARLPIAERLEDATNKAGDASLKINRLKRELEEAQAALNPDTNAGFDLPFEKLLKYQEDLKKLPQEIKNAEKEYERLNSESVRFTKQVNEHDSKIDQLNNSLSKQNQIVSDINARLENETADLSSQKEEAGHIVQQLDEAKKSAGGMGDMIDRAKARMDKLGKRILSLAASALVFNVISAGLRSLQQLTMKYIKTNDEARQAIAQLKGALLTLAQPLIEVIIPAFALLVNILTRIITAVAQFVSMLFGKTLNQSKEGAKALRKEASAIGAVGDAAEDAAGSLAGFDEINQINTENAKGAGGVGGAGDEIMPDFGDFNPGKYKDILDELMVYLSGALLVIGAILVFSGANIPLGLGLMVIGAAVLAQEIKENWGAIDGKVRDAVNRMLIILGGALLVIGAILCFTGANVPLGLGLMVVGAAMLATAVALNWGTMDEELRATLTNTLVILGGFLIVIGAILAFSGANIPLGIGMMIAGAAALATAAKLNWGEINEELKKTITDIAVLLAVSLIVLGAIIAFSGANIPLGIGLLIAGATSLAAAAVLDWNYVSSHIKEIVTAITAVLGTGLLALGAILCFSGANVPFGIGLMIAGAASLATAVAINWDSIVSAIRGPFGAIMAIACTALLVLGIILCCCGILPLGIALIAAGAVGLVTVTALNWNAILEKIKETVGDIKSWWNQNVAKYLTLDYWRGLGADIINGFKDGLKSKIEDLKTWWSNTWNGLFGNKKVSVGVETRSNSTVSTTSRASRMAARALPNIAPASIPALAQGAVIPPNREFMAVLGDQRSGTNIEAPLETIKQALAEVMQSNGSGGDIVVNITTTLDGRVLARNQVRHINDMTRQAGKPVLLI